MEYGLDMCNDHNLSRQNIKFEKTKCLVVLYWVSDTIAIIGCEYPISFNTG